MVTLDKSEPLTPVKGEGLPKVIKPKCPHCGKLQAEWITEASFTCPRCHTHFEISSSCLSILTKSET